MIAARSRINPANLQEVLDASGASAKETARKGQAQYFTPPWFAERMMALLPSRYSCCVVFDPQCGQSALLDASVGYGTHTFGVELDQRIEFPKSQVNHRLTANCVDVWRLLDEFFPHLTFRCQIANPPFGLRWRVESGAGVEQFDSTIYTWRQLLKRAGPEGCGFMIANRATTERLRLEREDPVYLYQTFPVGVFDAEVEIGVLHFSGQHTGGCHTSIQHPSADPEAVRRVCDALDIPDYDVDGTPAAEVVAAFQTIRQILAEEKRQLPPFNIWLDPRGHLKTYLSTRARLTRRFTIEDVERLAKINRAHPLSLTTERDTRLLLAELVTGGVYTVESAARSAIEAALREVEAIACPIMPITDFERVAYADEMEALEAITPEGFKGAPRSMAMLAKMPVFNGTPGVNPTPLYLTPGKRYPTNTATYSFVNHYERMRLHLDSKAGTTYACEHQVQLSGQDRFVSIVDDDGTLHRFLDRPNASVPTDHSDLELWRFFHKPEVATVAEKYAGEVKKNLAVMEACELLAGFEYFPGQREFYSRVAVRDYALVGAATGTGKTLGAITLIALKAPQRALIVAPQGTTKGGKRDDEDAVDDLQASQWITELRRFAPGLQVFELFSEADYERIVACNAGALPHGVYVTYYEAMFSNASRESWNPGSKFNDRNLARLLGVPDPHPDMLSGSRDWCQGIGNEQHGIRCIVTPCLATKIGQQFDFVALDEAHKACHLSAAVTQMIVRLQPRFRYALTATPIPNLVVDLFPLMGWLCVPGWYRGQVRNAAWPYAREEGHTFCTTFLSTERDLTQEAMNKEADPFWRGKCEKPSPIISSPARLLKLIKPTMAFISKEACNPAKPKLTIHDVRVPMGAQQARLYGHYMNRANVPHDNPMVKAAMQVAILRDLCAAPAASEWNRVSSLVVRSNFNPKTAAILSLIREILQKREQVVVVCSRLRQTDYLQRKLAESGVPVSRIDSSLPPERHTEQANLFKRGATPVLLMGIKCAQAHSFDQCRNLICGSLEYSFGTFEQARGRIDRVTSRLPMDVYCVLHKNSIEEIMFDVVATKGDAATICLQGQRVPRDYIPADLGDVLAKNFAQFNSQLSTLNSLPDETTVEAGWPPLCQAIRAAVKQHPCQLASNG